MHVTFGREEKSGPGPLDGIKVLDLSTVVSGPMCAQILGDMGAEVIKVETLGGDTTRRMGPPFHEGLTGWFAQFNRNKRAISLDLKNDEARKVFLRLAKDVDVLVENYRPGVAERLGIGYETLAAENPGLIYVAINGFGPDGPYADLPAYDSVIQALSGFMSTQGGAGEEPALIRSIAADKTSSLTATYGLMAALFARERDPDHKGQKVEIPMLDAYVAFMMPDIVAGETFQPKQELPTPPEIHRTWETGDGHVAMMIIEDHQFHGLLHALDRVEMIDDPRCANLVTRIIHFEELMGELGEELKKYKTEELVERCRKHGAPVAPANDIPAMFRDPQIQHSQVVFETDHDVAGTLRLIRNPVRFGHNATTMRRQPPQLGEQTDDVLREVGYSDQEIAELREANAIG